jgi:predicted RNA-binding Zn-ribbon protein involved in translation (DUF1610 family)
MAVFIFVLVPIAIVAIVGVVFTLAVRGKQLKCPNCGTVFNAPTVDNKISGLGWTFPYTGRVKCPKCGESRSRRDYLKAPAPTEKAPAT